MKIQLYGTDKKLQETVRLEKFEDRFGTGYDYMVYNTETGVEGYVEVRLRDLDWFEERAEPVTRALQKAVEEEDTIAEIQRFYPHGQPILSRIPRQVLRRGIGTSVLRSVMGDLWLEGINNFYCFNPAMPFYELLLRQKFKELKAKDGNEHLFRRLKAR